MDPTTLAKLVSEAKPQPDDRFLRIDVTTPLDVSELSYARQLTMPIELSQIVWDMRSGGTAIVRRSWFSRVWATLTRRGKSSRVGVCPRDDLSVR
jgi:hypothetical protein